MHDTHATIDPEITGDPEPATGLPLKQGELDAIRVTVNQTGTLSPWQAKVLLRHVDWLNDELERVAEQRDTYRDLTHVQYGGGTAVSGTSGIDHGQQS